MNIGYCYTFCQQHGLAVCLSMYLLVILVSNQPDNAKPIKMTIKICAVDSCGSKEPCIRWVHIGATWQIRLNCQNGHCASITAITIEICLNSFIMRHCSEFIIDVMRIPSNPEIVHSTTRKNI